MNRFFLTLTIIFFCVIINAQEQVFIKEYTYKASDEDSKITSRKKTLMILKEQVLEEAGIEVRSHTSYARSENNQGLNEQFRSETNTLVSRVVKTKILSEKWDGVTYYVKAQLKVNLKEIENKNRHKKNRISEKKRNFDKPVVMNSYKKPKKYKREKTGKSNKGVNITNASSTKDFYHLGQLSQQDGKFDEALQYYEKAVDINPKHDVALLGMGTIYFERGDYTNARKYLIRVIDLNGSNKKDAYTLLGELFYNIGDFKESISAFRKAQLFDFDWKRVYSGIGMAYLKDKNYKKAIYSLKRVLIRHPYDDETCYNLAIAYREAGRKKDYKKCMVKAANLGNSEAQEVVRNFKK